MTGTEPYAVAVLAVMALAIGALIVIAVLCALRAGKTWLVDAVVSLGRPGAAYEKESTDA